MFSVVIESSQLFAMNGNTFRMHRSGQKHFTVIANIDG
jgi:hypothetical protein